MAALPTIEELCAAIIQQSQNDTSDIGKKRTALIRRMCKYNVEGSKLYPILLTKYFANTTFTAKNEDIAAEEYILAGLADGVIRDMETRIQPEFITLFNSPQLDASGLEVFLSANPITDVNIIVDIELGYTPLAKAIEGDTNQRDNYELCKLLYLYGADPNYIADDVTTLPLLIAIQELNTVMASQLINWGANLNLGIGGILPIQGALEKYYFTQIGDPEDFVDGNREDARDILEQLIMNGANVSRDILVDLRMLELPIDIYRMLLEAFVQHGGNINEVDGMSLIEYALGARNVPFTLALISDDNFMFVPIGARDHSILYMACVKDMPTVVRVLLSTFSQVIDKDVQEGYDKRTFSKDVLDVLQSMVAVVPWKGFTQSDITKLHSIFEDPAVANNYALCPVCLQYVERSEACMYMKHDCSKGKKYHRGLYNMYKNAEGLIGWCTICGRISAGHRHYELGAASSSTKAPLRPEMGGDPFENDCSKTNGGGGLDEKLARFYRFREYARELQDDVGIKTSKEAWDELVEETWNAPLARQAKLLGKLKAAKTLGNASNFPANVVASVKRKNTVYADVPLPEGFVATTKSEGTYPGYPGDTTPLLTFHHQPNEHTIPEEEVVDYVEEIAASFAHEHFGDCVAWADGCVSRLYPEEIKDVVPANVYETYKKSFNRKFGVANAPAPAPAHQVAVAHQVAEGGRRNTRKRRKMRGGSGGSGEESMIIEASDAVCDIPPRANPKGGRRTRNKKTKANAKKSKKTKASRRH